MMDSVNNSNCITNGCFNETQISNPQVIDTWKQQKQQFYGLFCPILVGLAFCALLINAYILMAIRWMHRPISMHTALCLSLAAIDAWTSGLIILSLVFAFLPVVYQIFVPYCLHLTIEIFKQGGLISSVLHILALALNQYGGIMYTMQHRRYITGRIKQLTMYILWLIPTLCFLIFNFLVPGQLYRSPECINGTIFNTLVFRLVVSLFFFGPMLITFLLYGRIAHLLYSNTRKSSSDNNLNEAKRCNNGQMEKLNNLRIHNQQSQDGNSRSAQQKLLTTLMLMTGTFLVGWLPMTLSFLLICDECPLVSIKSSHPKFVFGVMLVANALIVVKLFINPLIYASRLLNLRFALWQMHVTRWGGRPLDITKYPIPRKFQTLIAAQNFAQVISRRRMELAMLDQKKNGDGLDTSLAKKDSMVVMDDEDIVNTTLIDSTAATDIDCIENGNYKLEKRNNL